MSRSIQYNNAGVAFTEAGRHREAWELFKGALELKLAVERYGSEVQDDDEFVAVIQKDNAYIQRAEYHFRTMTCQRSRSVPTAQQSTVTVFDRDTDTVHNPSSTYYSMSQSQFGRHSPVQADLMDDMYSPFLFRHPMRLDPNLQIPTRKESATVIFNLALVDHLKNRCSEQAVQLYELAMTLLTGDVVDTLGIALMNNIGVWCYENGDLDGTRTCMGHLATFLASCGYSMDNDQRDGLQSNILWLTNPPFAASPAA